jgi:uncharacterized protein (UPF0332 family)
MNPEARKLLDKAAHALNAADLLLEGEEVDFAAGRAYYAMFYTAQALLLAAGLSFARHTAVHAGYGQEFAKTGSMDPKFHRWLLDAYDQRIRADYATGGSLEPEDVHEIMAQAREFLHAAHRFLGDEAPPKP